MKNSARKQKKEKGYNKINGGGDIRKPVTRSKRANSERVMRRENYKNKGEAVKGTPRTEGNEFLGAEHSAEQHDQ